MLTAVEKEQREALNVIVQTGKKDQERLQMKEAIKTIVGIAVRLSTFPVVAKNDLIK